MLSILDLKAECIRLSKENGDVFNVPVVLNGRLRTTLAQCKSTRSAITGLLQPKVIEVSKWAMQELTDEELIDIIRHEWSHYYLAKTDPASHHGHDNVFRDLCKKVNCDHSATRDTEGTEERKKHKYTVFCPKCGEIGGYDRMCKTLKNIQYAEHTKCGSTGLTYEVNW